MERRRIRKEEEKERERKKKELKKSFRKEEKGKVKSGLSKVTAAKIIIILAIIITPIVIFFVYQYFESEKEPQYSFLTEGDHVFGTWLKGNQLNFTYIKSEIAYASTTEFMSLEFTDDYPFDTTLYSAQLKKNFGSVLAIPYDVHPHDHHGSVGDCYVEFMFAFLHNVPDLFYVLRTTDEVVYPAVLEWYYILNGTNLETLDEEQEKFFFNPEIEIIYPGVELTATTRIRVIVNITAGFFNSLGMTEITMIFKDTNKSTFSDPDVFIGGVKGRPGYYTFKSRKTRVGPLDSMFLDFNITVNSNQSFTNENLLSSGGISFQFTRKLLQDIYHSEGFGSLEYNLIGIPEEDQIEALIYMLRQKYTNFHINIPPEALKVNCTI